MVTITQVSSVHFLRFNMSASAAPHDKVVKIKVSSADVPPLARRFFAAVRTARNSFCTTGHIHIHTRLFTQEWTGLVPNTTLAGWRPADQDLVPCATLDNIVR